MLEVDIQRKAFGTNGGTSTVLESRSDGDLRFSVRPGQIVCLYGPSGCGKSTLLRMISGIDTDYAGTVHLNGTPVVAPTRRIGLTVQGHAAFDWLTVADNITFGLRYHEQNGTPWWRRLVGAPNPIEARAEALRLADLVGLLEPDLEKYPEQISGGMKQRMLFARALLPRPELLLLDEPFSSLDYESRNALQEVVLRIRDQTGTSFICVSHDPDETLFIADEVLVLGGKPARIIHREQPGFRGCSRARFTVEFQEAKQRLHSWLSFSDSTV